MKFDLLYELQTPKPHDERSEYRCYQEALEQIELADRLGYDTLWTWDQRHVRRSPLASDATQGEDPNRRREPLLGTLEAVIFVGLGTGSERGRSDA